ncbi:DUF5916 domain-containing protein [Calditrichota bacterium]
MHKIFIIFFLFCSTFLWGEEPDEIYLERFLYPIKVDGLLNEYDWKQAAQIKNFYSFRPIDGKPAKEETAVLMGYSKYALYVAVICFDPIPSKIRASITNRDDIFDDDFIILYLDTFNDGKNAYQFAFNPYGIQADGIYLDSVGDDFNPDYILYSKGRRFKKGYILEIEIPFKSLRFPAQRDLTWGISFLRRINHLDKDIIWPAISRNQSTFIPQFGKLKGISGIRPGKNIEILPELTSNQQGELVNNDFKEGAIEYEAGINLKYGITSNFTLDLAYNPDFSQIEADADKIDVNRRFPLFYDEKRPFFLEGTNIFQTPINAVYTRRIVNPLAGFKATGQIGDYSIGILGSIDEYYGSKNYLNEISQFQSIYDPNFDQQKFINKYLYKDSYHGVVRLKKNILDYSNIGVLATNKEQGDVFSRTFGVDGTLNLANQYIFTYQALHSISKNFFDGKQKNDPAFNASVYHGTRTFSFQLFYNDIFPDFEAANGFLERTDTRQFGSYFWYDFLSEKSFFPMIKPSLYSYQIYDHENNKIEQIVSPAITFETKGRTELTLTYFRMMEEFAYKEFIKNQYLISLNNKTFSWLFLNIEAIAGDGIYYGYPPFKGYVHSITSTIESKPTNQWASEIRLNNYLFHGWHNSQKYRIQQDIYRFKTTYQFTRLLFLRLIVEHNNYYKDLDLNVLFSYQFIPGTVAFLGYNDYFIEGLNSKYNVNILNHKYNRFSRGFFAKVSYLLRF